MMSSIKEGESENLYFAGRHLRTNYKFLITFLNVNFCVVLQSTIKTLQLQATYYFMSTCLQELQQSSFLSQNLPINTQIHFQNSLIPHKYSQHRFQL